MTELKKIFKIELKIWFRTWENVFWGFCFPTFWFFLCWFAFPPVHGHSRTYSLSYFFPAGVCLVILIVSSVCLSITIANYKEKRVLKRFATTPLSPKKYLLIELLVCLLFTTLGIATLSLVAFVGGVRIRGSFTLLISYILLGMLTFISVAFLIGGISKNSKIATILSFVFMFTVMFISNFWMDLSFLPDAAVAVSKALPGTPLCTILRKVVLDQRFLPGELSRYTGTLLGWLAGLTLLNLKTFKWQ